LRQEDAFQNITQVRGSLDQRFSRSLQCFYNASLK
jgi:hypothetical protein